MVEPALRQLTVADAGGWAEMRHRLWPHASLAELREELDGLIAEGRVGFGAFAGPELVGFAEAGERSYGDGCDTSPVAWLEGIYVDPRWRRHGLGRQLVAAVEGWARSRRHRELGSDAPLDNIQSRLSHAHWGFAETKRVVYFRRVLA